MSVKHQAHTTAPTLAGRVELKTILHPRISPSYPIKASRVTATRPSTASGTMSDRRQADRRDVRDPRRDYYDDRRGSQSSGGGYPASIIDAYRSSSGSETRTVSASGRNRDSGSTMGSATWIVSSRGTNVPSSRADSETRTVSPERRNRDSGSTMSATTWITSSRGTNVSSGSDDRNPSPRGRASGTTSATYISGAVQTSPARPNVRTSPAGGSSGRSSSVMRGSASRAASIREASRGPSPGSARGSLAPPRPSSTESERQRRRQFEAGFDPSERQLIETRARASTDEREAIRFAARMSPEERHQATRWAKSSTEKRREYRQDGRDRRNP